MTSSNVEGLPIIAASSVPQKWQTGDGTCELKARFDEDNNIQWARQWNARRPCGVRCTGPETHTKIVLVVRKEQEKLRSYVHIGTGNYNSKPRSSTPIWGFFPRRSWARIWWSRSTI